MAEQQINILLAVGTSDFMHEGHARYLFGPDFCLGVLEAYVVFPLEGESSLLLTSRPKSTEGEPVLEQYSRDSWIKDTKATPRDPSVLVKSIQKKMQSRGTLGVTMDTIPAYELDAIRHQLPEVKLVDASNILQNARMVKSEEEIRIIEKSAQLADESYFHALDITRRGSTHCNIVAAADQAARSGGAEKVFNLLVAGPKPLLPWWPNPSSRIRDRDLVVFELTPRYYGYWTQLVRCCAVGKVPNEMKDIYSLCVEAEKTGSEQARPGKKVSDIAVASNRVIREAGYKYGNRSGHSIGLDISEFDIVESNNTTLTPGMVLVIHPSVILGNENLDTSGQGGLFGPGDTYLVTDSGPCRLTSAGLDLPVR